MSVQPSSRFVHAGIITSRDANTAAACLKRFLEAFGHPVHTILTGNGSEFTDRFAADMIGKPSRCHPFDKVCAAKRIKHKLTKPFHPQANGIVERFNRRHRPSHSRRAGHQPQRR